jgi:flagellar biosynthesis protein FlhG
MSFEDAEWSSTPLPEPRHRTITFTSGKGGVGKSNLVLNTALLLAERGQRVAVLDGDLGLANVTVLLGQAPKLDLRDVLSGDRRLDEILLRGPRGILVIPAGSGVAELAGLHEGERRDLLAQVRELDETVDFMLIDTGAGIGETVVDLILAGDESVLVTMPEPTALADAYALMKTVLQIYPNYPFHVLVNMVRDGAQAGQVQRSLAEIARRFLGYQPGDAGFVVSDATVSQGVVRQVPFTLLSPRSPASRCLGTMVERLLGRPGAPRPERTFWERVAGSAWRRA